MLNIISLLFTNGLFQDKIILKGSLKFFKTKPRPALWRRFIPMRNQIITVHCAGKHVRV